MTFKECPIRFDFAGRLGNKAQQRKAQGGLAAPRFAHDPGDFSLVNIKGNVRNGAHDAAMHMEGC
jgi:hypothetical protein